MYQPGQLVEVAGTIDEGFQGSWVTAVILKYQIDIGAKVQYLEFIEEETGNLLVEDVPNERLRPALPSSINFRSWDELQVGMCVEYHQDDVWWQGLALRSTPAGMHIYMPDVDHSVAFCKLLKKLRPAYDWVPPKQQPQQQQHLSCKQEQQQGGYWVPRALTDRCLQDYKLTRPKKEASLRLPRKIPHEPMFSELNAHLLKASSSKAAAASEGTTTAAVAAASEDTAAAVEAGRVSASPMDAAAGGGLDQQGHPTAAVAAKGKPGGSEAASAGDDAAGLGGDTNLKQQQQLRMQMPDAMDEDADAPQQLQQSSAHKRGRRLSHSNSSSSAAAAAAGAAVSPAAAAAGSGCSTGVRRFFSQPKAPQAAAPAVAASVPAAAAAVTPPRRSNREAKKRVVYVDGIPVLRDNLYGPEGEPSVFDKELADKPYTEQGYPTSLPLSPSAIARQQQLAHLRQQRQQERAEREARCTGGKPPTGRQSHNAGVKASAQATSAVRMAYLASHLAKLRPFIAPNVAEAIKRGAEAAPAGALNLPDPPSSQPEQIKATLRDYQLEGMGWLVQQHQRGLNSILADEMGLGKTLQTIAFLAHLKYNMGVSGPHLVVVPLSVMSSWMAELAKWCPDLRAVKLHTSDLDERKRLRKQVLSSPESFDVAVTTYEMVNSPDFGRAIQTSITWRYLVLDEGHRIRNEDTLTVKALRLVRRGNVLLLTGTPLQNNMVELYGLLSFMYPDIFTTPGPFEAAFNLTKGQVDKEALSDAHYLLRPFCLRRIKNEVEVTLPPKVETRIAVPLSEQQTFWYRRLLLRNHEALSQLEAAVTSTAAGGKQVVGDGNAWKRLMNLIMQLRKVVNHPFMLPDSEPRGEGTSTLDELLEASGKLSVLDRLLSKLKARGHRVVLFSQFTMMLDILADYLDQAGYKYTRLDGSTNRVQRMINISQFQKPGSDIFIFLSSTRSGGLGLNLQSADTVILYDSDWNPQMDLQAMARVHRIGQTKPVHVYRLITSSSVEERMLQRADAKLYLDQMVNRGSTARAQQLDSLNTAELLSMLSFGADRILANKSGEPPSDADLDIILDRSKDAAAKAAAAQAADAAAGKQQGSLIKQENGVATKPEDEPAATAAGPSSGSGAGASGTVLMACHLTAASFVPDKPAPNTFQLNGVDYSREALQKLKEQAASAAEAAARIKQEHDELPLAQRKLLPSYGEKPMQEEAVKAQLRDIAKEYWAQKGKRRMEIDEYEAAGHKYRPERSKQARLINVDGYEVLKVNNYGVDKGGISAWEETQGGRPSDKPAKRKLQKPGRDYAHSDTCQICWDGGDLVCCDVCPAAYHADCLGQDPTHLATCKHWACPHHSCAMCGRGPAAAGGLLFRCGVCESAWCEDHLPADHEILGEWPMFMALGQDHPSNACFVFCGPDCHELHKRLQPTIQHTIDLYEANPELRYREACEDDQGNLKSKKKAKKNSSNSSARKHYSL